MKILNIKKWLIAAFVVSVILCSILLILNSNFNNVAYADSNSSSTSNTIQIDGPKSVYRGESETYIARSTSDFSFIVFSVDDNNIIIQEVNEDSVILYITDDALLYSVFTLTAEDQVTNARATLQIMVLPVYADSIEKVGMSVGGVPIDSENPIVQPGDKIDIRIESFKVDDVVYGISNNVTYPDFAVVLDDSSTGLATIDEFKISVLVSESQTEDNPFIKFTIVVIQHKAPLQIQNLTKEIVVNIYNPVKSLTVEKISGESHRDSTLKYNVRYNANNVASIKGYKIRVVPIEDAIVDNESYFDVYSNTIYDFSIEIDKQAPYGAGITVYVISMDNNQIYDEFSVLVNLLEESYSVEYSKDYQGANNPNNGIQLIEVNNKTQLRNNYNVDFYLRGATTQTLYTVGELRQWGVDVELTYNGGGYLEIIDNKKISMKNNAPAYTNNQKTTFQYQIEISDGKKSYATINKSIEVFRPLGNSLPTSFYLSGASNGLITTTSYSVVITLQGSNFTARASDIAFTSSDPTFTVNNKIFKALSPASASDLITITAYSTAYYNGKDLDSNWRPQLTVKRRFVASQNHLAKLKNASSSDTYYLINDISLTGYWTPISFKGTLEGQYHKILNLKISASTNKDAPYGLFSENLGSVKNLILSNYTINISASNSAFIAVGAIAGFNGYQAQVYDCTVEKGTITVNYHYAHVGTIVGQNQGLIYNCFSMRDNVVKGYSYLGGIAGFNTSGGVIQACNSYTDIYYTWNTENKSVGGIVGYNDTNSIVTTSYYGGYIEWKCTIDDSSIKPSIGYIIGCNKGNYSSCQTISPSNLIECKSGGWWLWSWNQSDNCFKIDGGNIGSA